MLFYWVVIFWILIDFFSKKFAWEFLIAKKEIFWDFFYLEYVKNTWIAFSFQIPFLKIITIFLVVLIFYYYLKEKKKIKNKKLLDLSFWLILAGAIWNWIWRIFYWYVVDFIWIKYFSVFNFADIFISIWVVLYFYILFIKNKKWVFDQVK